MARKKLTAPICVAFRKRLREARIARGWTMEELAARARISRIGLAQIELGTAWPRPQTIEKLAAALDIPTSELFAQE